MNELDFRPLSAAELLLLLNKPAIVLGLYADALMLLHDAVCEFIPEPGAPTLQYSKVEGELKRISAEMKKYNDELFRNISANVSAMTQVRSMIPSHNGVLAAGTFVNDLLTAYQTVTALPWPLLRDAEKDEDENTRR